MFSNMAASLFIQSTGLPFWGGGIFLVIFSLVLYSLNTWLIAKYIEKYAPGILSIDAALPPPKKNHEYLWEKTAGAGIVPKWVSWIGLGAIACLVGSVTWLLVWLWPR